VHVEAIHSFCPAAAKINFVFNGSTFMFLVVLQSLRLPMLRAECARVTKTPEICRAGPSSSLML
jgi:hypothetical protein